MPQLPPSLNPDRMVDNCFALRIVLAGTQGIGKTSFIQRVKHVKSFEKLASGAAPPPASVVGETKPTEFVEEYPM